MRVDEMVEWVSVVIECVIALFEFGEIQDSWYIDMGKIKSPNRREYTHVSKSDGDKDRPTGP